MSKTLIAKALGGGGHRNAAGAVIDWDAHNRILGGRS